MRATPTHQNNLSMIFHCLFSYQQNLCYGLEIYLLGEQGVQVGASVVTDGSSCKRYRNNARYCFIANQ